MASCCAGPSSLIAHAENKPNSKIEVIVAVQNAIAQAMHFSGLFTTCSFVTLDFVPAYDIHLPV